MFAFEVSIGVEERRAHCDGIVRSSLQLMNELIDTSTCIDYCVRNMVGQDLRKNIKGMRIGFSNENRLSQHEGFSIRVLEGYT